MLPLSQRLNLKTDFKWVASGKKLETKYLKLFIRLGENQIPRIGIALSTKSFKKATQRNRARRVVSHAFLSFDYGLLSFFAPEGACKFEVSCSEYTKRAIDKYGITKGVFLGFRRILTCK